MSERERRFLNLEPNAPEEPEGEARAPVSGRFTNLTESGNPVAAPDALREARAAQLQSGLALDDHRDDEQPFVRCGQCETDSNREAVKCQTCGARLDTPMQRAFNAHLWQQRKAELAKEREAQAAAMEKAELTGGEALEAQRHALGVSLAQSVREREESNLLCMDQPHGMRRVPLGWWLLDVFEDFPTRAGIAAGALMAEAWLMVRLFSGNPPGVPGRWLLGLLALLTLPLGRFRKND